MTRNRLSRPGDKYTAPVAPGPFGADGKPLPSPGPRVYVGTRPDGEGWEPCWRDDCGRQRSEHLVVLGETMPRCPEEPVCSTCDDTHMMSIPGAEVMCTRCPVPCQDCRSGGNGPYCTGTPCSCSCHQPTATSRRSLDALISVARAFAPGYARVSVTVDCGETVVTIEASAATGPDGMARLAADLGLPAPTPRSGARETWLETDLVDRQRQLLVSLTGCWAPIVGTVVP